MPEVSAVIAAMDSALYEGIIPLALAVQWEHEGAAAWAVCEDPRPMVRILVGVDARLGARVAAACARTALGRLAVGDASIATNALDAADAWGRGVSDGSECYAAGRAATTRAYELHETEPHAGCALYAAAHAAYVAHASMKNAMSGAADHAGRAALAAATVRYETDSDAEADTATLRALADLVRSMSGCPTPAVEGR